MKNLKKLREHAGVSQPKLAKVLGYSRQAISQYESGKREPSLETIDKIKNYFNVTMDELTGKKEIIKKNRIAVLGHIPAGIPIEAIEDILDYEEIPNDWLIGNKEYFALKVSGKSMYPKYMEEDVVIVLKQNTCNNGEDCVVMVNGFDATLKKVFIKEDGILLQPYNSDFEPIFYTKKEVANNPGVTVLGVIKEIRRKV